MVNHYPLKGGKERLVIKTHNSAYDDGTLRLRQMEYLEDFLLAEYEKGNYIVVGGDWNQSPPGFTPGFSGDIFDDQDVMHLEAGYPAADWQWVFDASVPTNRRVVTPYRKGASPTTVIDFFLLSPNVEPVSVQTEDLGFSHSDHHPVKLEFRLQVP
jgi:endonuclease/exonuclease/phosphatase family metal-dependent hydrolase